MWHIMTYDYSVSALPDANTTAPNSPLYNPPNTAGVAGNWSVNSTVQAYLAAGVPAKKIMIGVALYGHTWWAPSITGTGWQKYGVSARIQGLCCGTYYSKSYGGREGVGDYQCGNLMASEIQAKLGSLDNGYFEPQSSVMIGYTNDGTWITYENIRTVLLKADYVKKFGLAGIFVFDSSMDTIATESHIIYSYALTKAISASLGGAQSTASAITATATTSSTTSTTGTPCDGKPIGMYCVGKNQYMYCPSGAIQTCQPGLSCVQEQNVIYCE